MTFGQAPHPGVTNFIVVRIFASVLWRGRADEELFVWRNSASPPTHGVDHFPSSQGVLAPIP